MDETKSIARRTQQAWLRRRLEVTTADGVFTVEYSGRGFGYESVRVDGRLAARPRSWMWFVPRIPFRIGTQPALLEVQVSPWLAFRRFRLWVSEHLAYAEPVAAVDTGGPPPVARGNPPAPAPAPAPADSASAGRCTLA